MFFRRLEDLRSDHDLKIKEVAEYLQTHPNVYSRYEKGEREIPVWALVKLSELYGCSTDYILGLTDRYERA
jgi:transcriptional regulator with XRE-family HTH domain